MPAAPRSIAPQDFGQGFAGRTDVDLLDQLLTSIPDYIYFKDRESRFMRISATMARRFELGDPGEAVGKTDADFYGEEHARQAYADDQHVMSTGVALVGIEEKETWPDGRVTWVSSSKVPMRDSSGRVVGLLGISRDVTERKAREEEARLNQRVEAIGRLAGGVAHDFNNLLAIIIGYGERVALRLPADGRDRVEQSQLLKAAHRASDLTRQLLAFGSRQVLEPRVLDLNEVVAEMEHMLRRLIGEQYALEVLLDRGLGKALADPGQTGQILLNLVVNARDAMPQGGRLRIETSNVHVDASHASSPPGSYVMLAVSDTGVGMDAETQAHVFEPFFTTKAPGHGTGLGLATVYGIVRQSGGFILVASEPDVGTTFKVYLPRIDSETTELAEACATTIAPPQRGSETVLLIEDEDSLRDVIARTLEENGYTVLAAGDGAEALQRLDEYPAPVALLVTDVIMPGMTGRQAAENACAARPGLKVLYISGYTQDVITKQGALEHGALFLAKPFTGAALLHKCRQALDG